MKTDRYKTSYLNRLSNRGAVDGFAQGSMRRSNYTAATGSRRTSQKSTNMPVTTDGAVNVQAAPHPEVTQVIESVDQQDALFTNNPGHFSLPSYEPPARLKLVVGKRKKMRRTIARISAVFAALIIVGSSLFVWRGYTTASKVLSGSTTVPVLSSEKVDPTLLKGEGDGRVNVLLLGIGGPNHDGGDLTDTMILASIDPVNHGVVLLSIPRDLWVKMPAGFFGSSLYCRLNC